MQILAELVKTKLAVVPVENAPSTLKIKTEFGLPCPFKINVPFNVAAAQRQYTLGAKVCPPPKVVARTKPQVTALNEPYAVFRLAAACAVITFARCIWPITIPGGNPEKAPTLVPISPLILVMPSLLKAPVEVKTLNLDAELKSIT